MHNTDIHHEIKNLRRKVSNKFTISGLEEAYNMITNQHNLSLDIHTINLIEGVLYPNCIDNVRADFDYIKGRCSNKVCMYILKKFEISFDNHSWIVPQFKSLLKKLITMSLARTNYLSNKRKAKTEDFNNDG